MRTTRFLFVLLAIGLLAGCSSGSDPADPGGGDSSCLDRAHFGDPANSSYILPFPVGERFLCSQDYCYSRGGHSNQLSYDFDMNIGDVITAARRGTVITTVDHFPDTGQGEGNHNYIFILHPDGTLAFYAHLQQNGLLVALNDEVWQGQPIAYSGNSGLTGGPHLHFGVYQYYPPREGDDVPMNFRNAEGPLDERGGLIMGQWYEALPDDGTAGSRHGSIDDTLRSEGMPDHAPGPASWNK
jgi:murein DD-endopeptidase MepM/ murein hydrolase activator NlpD